MIGTSFVILLVGQSVLQNQEQRTKTFPLHSSSISEEFGQSALRQVQSLASRVATANERQRRGPDALQDNGGPVMRPEGTVFKDSASDENQVWAALENLERDMQMLDRMVIQKPQLSTLEFSLLCLSVIAAASGPFLGGEVTSVLSPASAAFSAAIGIGAEYVGKVAVADSKEVAASALSCSAEAEGFLANAERVKAVTPICVGIGATAATFALLIPVLLKDMNIPQTFTEVYLLCPLVGIFTASVANLALEETKSFCRRAMSVGNRRFAKSGLVGRTWLSSTEQIAQKSSGTSRKWRTFAVSVLPAPLIGALIPGALPTKTIVTTAVAATQTAFYLAQSEAALSRATDAVALKSRSAAVCDTYANQGARSAAILPFTSALSSLCAAATAAIVEFPFVESLGQATAGGVVAQSLVVASFPAISALLAAAASVSKARCEVDAEATLQAASTLSLEYDGSTNDENDPVLRPVQGTIELVRQTIKSSLWEPFRQRCLVAWGYPRQWVLWLQSRLQRR